MAIASTPARLAVNDAVTSKWAIRHGGQERGLVSVHVRLLSIDDDEALIQISAADDGVEGAFNDAATSNQLWLTYARGFGWISFGIGWLVLAGNALIQAFGL